jgi:type II secretory pathway component PulM
VSVPGLIAALALTALVILFIAAPFWRRSQASTAQAAADLQRERVLAYYERVLRNMRDLDEDHALGKLDEAGYQRDRALWAEKGVQALRLLDTLEAGSPAVLPSGDAAELDTAVERAIQAAMDSRAT